MRRVRVSENYVVVDYEAGIGGEGYDPPKPRRQLPTDAAVQSAGPIIEGERIHDWHREWVEAESWLETDQAPGAANLEGTE